ncbi:hypothetical protein [Burkholderia gladioli]|uniref:hypothetical protein n=1 Tax=Burkholderia gladioli TaxID=28095 RepID=UPI0015E68EF4|nr:hypothetical protein [Burkholderia gladioli]MBA1366947.1 hypothetical protein [Burkholderia gladioli]
MSDKLSELEPCRWCKGTKAKVLDFAESAIHVACPCGVQMFGGRAHFGSREEAIAAWNSASPAPAIPAEKPTPTAWVRFRSDGGFEGPIMDSDERMCDTRRTCGAWMPLYLDAPAISESEDARDAARYRWLRDVSVPPHNFYLSVPVEFDGVRYTRAEVDAAIDAAIDAARKGEKS